MLHLNAAIYARVRKARAYGRMLNVGNRLRIFLFVIADAVMVIEERRQMAEKMGTHLAAERDAFVFFKHEESPEGALYAAELLQGSGTGEAPAQRASGL